MSTAPITLMVNRNNQEIVVGPVVDGVLYKKNPPVLQIVTDLVITSTLYRDRSLTDPDTTPGTIVTAYGSGGSLPIPYTGANGVYMGLLTFAFFAPPGGNYVLVFDAPLSLSGYQLHIERGIELVTREN